MNSVYHINKGINKSVEFKGLKAQYIWYLGAGIMGLMIVYACMYILNVNTYVSILIILGLGGGVVAKVYALSHKYGEHGLSKKMAKRSIPPVIICRSRRVFQNKDMTRSSVPAARINKR